MIFKQTFTKLIVTKKQIPDNNNTVLRVNVNNNESTSKDTPEHQNKDNYQEKICTTVSQNAPPNEKETS